MYTNNKIELNLTTQAENQCKRIWHSQKRDDFVLQKGPLLTFRLTKGSLFGPKNTLQQACDVARRYIMSGEEGIALLSIKNFKF